jgi:hypothetical protein
MENKDCSEEINLFNDYLSQFQKNNQVVPLVPNQERVLVHCKAGMSRSATALLSMYIFFIDVILKWHTNEFIEEEKDKTFFGAILKAIFHPSDNPSHDVRNIIKIFCDNYRYITPIREQVKTLTKLIEYKRNTLLNEIKILETTLPKNDRQNIFRLVK